jgi:hypothetical protein
MGSAALLHPFKVILPSARTVPVIMPFVLKVVTTLPCGSRAMMPPSPCCSTSSFMTTSLGRLFERDVEVPNTFTDVRGNDIPNVELTNARA